MRTQSKATGANPSAPSCRYINENPKQGVPVAGLGRADTSFFRVIKVRICYFSSGKV